MTEHLYIWGYDAGKESLQCPCGIEDTRKKIKMMVMRRNADRDEKVQATVHSLKTKHGVTVFTPMPVGRDVGTYHGDVHPGIDTPPTTIMFELVVVLQSSQVTLLIFVNLFLKQSLS